MRKPISRLNVVPGFAGHAAKPVFGSDEPIRFTARRSVPWLFLGALAGVTVVGFAVATVLINTLL